MKKVLFIAFLITSFITYAQLKDLGEPYSWSNEIQYSSQKRILPTVNLTKIIAEDTANKDNVNIPYRVGVKQKVNINLQNDGQWTNLENGDRLWQINIKSPGALYLSAIFSDLFIPNGATLYIFNNAKTEYEGAFTSINNNPEKKLGTWFTKGDDIWIEYFEPANVRGLGTFTIKNVIHTYRLKKEHESYSENQRINESGSCNQDVDCPVGADFDTTKDELKHSVGFLSLGNGYVCSGTLINNTSEDKTPYFLTANHCYDGSSPSAYSVRFNWISPNPSCATYTGSTQASINNTMYGSAFRATNTNSDFALVEFNNNIPQSWDIRFAGWDNTDTNPTYEVGIHHPSGDIMKVCRDDTGAIKTQTSGSPIWLIGGTSAGGGNGWELGVTEGGSSGSALFDQNGRVIGQLWAGQAACTGTNDNNDYDFYGRFAASWTGNNSNATRLSNWLDPTSTGQTTLDLLNNDSTASVANNQLNTFINVYPNPSTGNLTIDLNGLSGTFKYEVINLLGQRVISDMLTQSKTTLNISNLENNIYVLKITNTTTEQSKIQKFVLKK